MELIMYNRQGRAVGTLDSDNPDAIDTLGTLQRAGFLLWPVEEPAFD